MADRFTNPEPEPEEPKREPETRGAVWVYELVNPIRKFTLEFYELVRLYHIPKSHIGV